MHTFSFDIETTTHDLMKNGIVAGRFYGSQHHHQRITIAVSDEDCITDSGFRRDPYSVASEMAIQMGFCFGYVTSCHVRE